MTIKSIGKTFYLLLLWIPLLGTIIPARADIMVTLDRQKITIDDTFNMIIRGTGGENLENIDLSPLESNFDVLASSKNSNYIFSAGKKQSSSELILSLAPRHTGTLYIPELSLGNLKTNATQIIVGQSSPISKDQIDTVYIEVETNKDILYVQEQLIFTVRIFQAINLENSTISELKIDNSFVEKLSQNSTQRLINGATYLVHVIKYAIFPQKSGSFKIPSLSFSGTHLNPRRSLFDMGTQGKLIKIQSEAKIIIIKPIPQNNVADIWLPAAKFTLDESWSKPPENLSIGESATRTLTIRSTGLLSEQLPPLLPPIIEGIKLYPDQPALDNQKSELGITSVRIDSSAMVITKAGTFIIPGITLQWWDTSKNQIQLTSIPPRTLTIAAKESINSLTNPHQSINENKFSLPIDNESLKIKETTASKSSNPNPLRFWQLLACISALAWLFTIWLLLKKRKKEVFSNTITRDSENEKTLYKALITTFRSDNLSRQREAIIKWAQSYWKNSTITTILEVSQKIDDAKINNLLTNLDASLYSPENNTWDKKTFITSLNTYKKNRTTENSRKETKLKPLYS